jgi:hypothetical protein
VAGLRPPFHPLWLKLATDALPLMRLEVEGQRVLFEVDQEHQVLHVVHMSALRSELLGEVSPWPIAS